MSRLFPDFTDKMEYLFMDIIASLGQLPIEVCDSLFCLNGEVDMEWAVGFAGYSPDTTGLLLWHSASYYLVKDLQQAKRI